MALLTLLALTYVPEHTLFFATESHVMFQIVAVMKFWGPVKISSANLPIKKKQVKA